MLHDAELVREQGIERVVSDVLNLSPKEKKTALNILTHKGLITEEQREELDQAD